MGAGSPGIEALKKMGALPLILNPLFVLMDLTFYDTI